MGRMKSELANERAEELYPYTVDVDVPPDSLGKLDRMLKFLGTSPLRVPEWDQHGMLEQGGDGEESRHWARFYFINWEQADLFAAEFQDLGAELREKEQPDG